MWHNPTKHELIDLEIAEIDQLDAYGHFSSRFLTLLCNLRIRVIVGSLFKISRTPLKTCTAFIRL